ncbi:MAG: 5-formyltetrahydrofolate cyclo-ligase [Bacteroidetes bacterium]|nr:MAG: 5-formyltetrahydrofolate cyclo-ligase [Bacteroidota bacterium]TAE63889.1 MAG: 5-formyltetrahydrofolate cyclo-ligase [Bacteroidota bacterium]TAF94538.1 MAG: 5-formyltetrahydrofolate cyclo-ligase [Bacteroidota bacterium]
MTKNEIRQLYKEKRQNIPSKEKLRLDDLLLLQLQNLHLGDPQFIATYWPLGKANEPNMHIFNGYCRHAYPQATLCFPVVSGDTMEMMATNADTVYHTNSFGIYEPKQGERISAADIDIVFVPCIVCDMGGNRIGFGKGYYDRFLAHTTHNTVIIAFQYFEPLVNRIPVNDWDIAVDYIITPTKIFTAQGN